MAPIKRTNVWRAQAKEVNASYREVEMANRRDFLKAVPAAAGAAALIMQGVPGRALGMSDLAVDPDGNYLLQALPYDYAALEPHIDEQTMRLHHGKHHLGYVNGLNNALGKLKEAREKKDYSLIKHYSREAAFHGSGHLLHALFWQNMSPNGGGEPQGELAQALANGFISFADFRDQFTAAAIQVEGSGWAVLAYEPVGQKLVVLQAEKHQNLTQWGAVPLLVVDVWEHAYYLKYQNRRGDFVKAFFNVINWSDVAQRFAKARSEL